MMMACRKDRVEWKVREDKDLGNILGCNSKEKKDALRSEIRRISDNSFSLHISWHYITSLQFARLFYSGHLLYLTLSPAVAPKKGLMT